MSGQPSRGLPIGPLLAIAGGGLGVASLLLPWFTVNTVGVNHAIDHIYSTDWIKGQQMAGFAVNNVTGTMHATVDQLVPKIGTKVSGYQTYSQVSVAAQAAGAGIAILVGFLGLFGLLRRRGLILFACAIAMLGRQVYSLVIPPGDKIMQSVGFENTHLLTPAAGFWIGMVAGVVLIASTFGITARAARQYDVPAGKYGNAGPHVATVGGNGSASSHGYAPGAAGQAAAQAYATTNFGAGQPHVPGVSGAMNSTTPLYGSEPLPSSSGAPYGTPSPGAAPYGTPPNSGGGPRRSSPPPLE